MNKIVVWFENPSHRAYLYQIAAVLTPLLVGGAVITSGTAQVILSVLSGLLGFGTPALARIHTPAPAPKPNQAGAISTVELLLIVVVVLVVLLACGVLPR